MSTLLEQASLVMIPSGYKEDTVYSVIPESGAGDLSFTRASNGTRVNSAGLVEVMPWNLINNSQAFNNWTQNACTIGADVIVAPDGTMTADSFSETATTAQHLVRQNPQYIAGYNYTASVYAKAGNQSQLCIVMSFTAFGANWRTAYFNLSTGTVISNNNNSGIAPTITSVGNGWYRCTFTNTCTTTVSDSFSFGKEYYSHLGDGQVNLYLWGAQLDIGSTAKTYFPTTDRLNVPRLDYSNGTCPALLLEKQSTNICLYSEQFDNAWWSKTAGSISANTTTSPDGNINADRFVGDGTTGQHILRHTYLAVTPSTSYTYSFYVKADGISKIGFYELGQTAQQGAFNLATQTVIFVSGSSSITLQSAANGYTKVSITTVAGSNGVIGIGLYLLDNSYTTGNPNTYASTVSNSQGIYIWGAQLEASSYATSYIPTTSASATRVADACSKTGISSLIGQSEGVLFADFIVNGRTNVTNILNSEKNTTASFYLLARTNGNIDVGLYQSGVIKAAIVAGSVSTKQRAKVAYAYKSGDSVLYINGVQVGTSADTFSLPSTLDDIFLNDSTTYFSYQENVSFNQVILFKTRLTNTELAQLTAL